MTSTALVPRIPGQTGATPRVPHPVMDRLRLATGLTDRQLALRLGLGVKAPYDCRRSGAIPYGHIIAAVRAHTLAVDLHWLFTGQTSHPGAPA